MQSQYICNYCNRSFTRKYNLQTHIQNCHINGSCHCDTCGQNFEGTSALQRHLSRGHNSFNQSFPECDLCGRIFTRKHNILFHMLTKHTQAVKLKCNLCDKTFTTDKNRKRHLKYIHNPNIQYPSCDICMRVFKQKKSLISHVQAFHNMSDIDKYKCCLCNKIYSNNRSLKRHIDTLHKTGEREENRCEVCLKVYWSHHSLIRHIRSIHKTNDLKEYGCQYCNKCFIGKENMECHISYYHKESIIGPYVCETCQKSFNEEPTLRQHIKKEHSFKTFYDYCKNFLLKKEELHRDKMNLVYCESCNAIFKSAYELKRHMKSSHNEQFEIYTCNVCFNKFYCKETIDKHKKICLPPQNVKNCLYCNKLFTDISSLQFHTRIFHSKTQTDDTNNHSSGDSDEMDSEYYDGSFTNHALHKNTCNNDTHNNITYEYNSNMIYLNNKWTCAYCEKEFLNKKNIQKHIQFKHLRRLRYKCTDCDKLFKEKRSLCKHVRLKHTYTENMKNLPKNEEFECEICHLICNGYEEFQRHRSKHITLTATEKQMPRCIICIKDFSTRRSLKRHIKKFHGEFKAHELATFGTNRRVFNVDCNECIEMFQNDHYYELYLKMNRLTNSKIFKCESCLKSYDCMEFAIQRYIHTHAPKNNSILSELCTAEMSDISTDFESSNIQRDTFDLAKVKEEPM